MKLMGDQCNFAGARFMTSAAMILMLAFAPSVCFAAKSDAHEDRAEMRIKQMHEKLKITPAQEEQWSKVEQAMREDAKTMDALTQARVDHAQEMTAIDDLKSYAEIAETHVAGIKKLTPLFTVLYDGLSDAQKKEADVLFRDGYHQDGHKHGRKPLSNK